MDLREQSRLERAAASRELADKGLKRASRLVWSAESPDEMFLVADRSESSLVLASMRVAVDSETLDGLPH